MVTDCDVETAVLLFAEPPTVIVCPALKPASMKLPASVRVMVAEVVETVSVSGWLSTEMLASVDKINDDAVTLTMVYGLAAELLLWAEPLTRIF